jgi:hypothetical protein
VRAGAAAKTNPSSNCWRQVNLDGAFFLPTPAPFGQPEFDNSQYKYLPQLVLSSPNLLNPTTKHAKRSCTYRGD